MNSSKYFIDKHNRCCGECLTDTPANPDMYAIVESTALDGDVQDYVWNALTSSFVLSVDADRLSGKIDQLSALVQARLDAFARTRTYHDMASACSYTNSAIDKWRQEAAYCVTVRDETWLKFHALTGAILNEQQSLPSQEEFIVMLPVLAWPDDLEEVA